VSGKPFQPSLMFARKTGAYPSVVPLGASLYGRSHNTYVLAGKAYMGLIL
jgi:hypothetical protein